MDCLLSQTPSSQPTLPNHCFSTVPTGRAGTILGSSLLRDKMQRKLTVPSEGTRGLIVDPMVPGYCSLSLTHSGHHSAFFGGGGSSPVFSSSVWTGSEEDCICGELAGSGNAQHLSFLVNRSRGPSPYSLEPGHTASQHPSRGFSGRLPEASASSFSQQAVWPGR